MKLYHLQSGPLRVNTYFLVNDDNQAIVIDGGENYKLISNTFNNQMGAFEYMKSQIPVAKQIASYLSETGVDPYTSSAAAQFKFENILTGLTERVIAESNANEEVAKRLWHNTQPRFVMGKDLNYFNFNIQGMFMRNSGTEYI